MKLVVALLFTVACGGITSASLPPGDAGQDSPSVDAKQDSPVVMIEVCPNRSAHVKFATIHETRSTNSPELFVDLYCDGSAERTLGAPGNDNINNVTAKSFPPKSPEVEAVLSDVNAVGDVGSLAAGSCGKSVSFGTVTTIMVGAKTSVDLQCIADPTPTTKSLTSDCCVLAPTTNSTQCP